jgi:hypothetical protein
VKCVLIVTTDTGVEKPVVKGKLPPVVVETIASHVIKGQSMSECYVMMMGVKRIISWIKLDIPLYLAEY